MVEKISSGSTYEELAGYSRAVVDGDMIYVSGTTGMDYSNMTLSDDVAEQTHQTFRNIQQVLQQAGSSLDDVLRVQYTITEASYFEQVAPIWGSYFANARPAATCVVAGLINPQMKIEIEVTARKGAAE
ncbi:RidA family protein [Curvivirga aplysinae]|uniref:RidA family protein n=1 Tax=Curvivirga aplysinae TaxID=2529852 RepID=UPI0012BD2DE3|nr:RidA family protein [Curvivirga aplysinae]MTI09195.1 RidA family protein [Curvivirga aplysinae]